MSSSSPTGTQFLQAVGCAEAAGRLNPASDEITLVACGEGATSEGEFWEAMNAACLDRLPVLFLVEDNQYAISVPVERQTAGGSISRLLEGFPGLLRLEVDGTDFAASHKAMTEAAAWCRERRGPALVHAHVIRPYSHSLSDDERLYKTAAERDGGGGPRSCHHFPAVAGQRGRRRPAARFSRLATRWTWRSRPPPPKPCAHPLPRSIPSACTSIRTTWIRPRSASEHAGLHG